MRGRAALLVVAVFSAAGCARSQKLRAEAEVMDEQLEEAVQSGVIDCAPAELARARATVDFFKTELRQAHWVRAQEHRDDARLAMKVVMAEARSCGRRDRDGDRVADRDDLCPDVKGSIVLDGCPDGDGDGIVDSADACPTQPEDRDGDRDEDGCPDIIDRDGDGILDPDDGCPSDPEDIDGFRDADGCPDPDNDQDGLLDLVDQCPNEPETQNNFQDEDGCPDVKLKLVEVKRDLGKIEIKQKIFFRTGKAAIRSRSFRLLDEVTEALTVYRGIAVLIEGHTDSTGSEGLNLRLSQARADAVRTYLIDHGIDEARLTAIGFGEGRPIDTNRTVNGRRRNRRVEFTIVDPERRKDDAAEP